MSALLDALRQGRSIEEEIAVVAAHPDDEILGLGSRLRHFRRLHLLHLTDGAPREAADANRAGYNTRHAYANARRTELGRALETAGAHSARLADYGYPDREAVTHQREMVERLSDDLAQASAVFTHPYEHGHPDHDAAAVGVALACERLRRRTGRAPVRYEFSSYHLGPAGPVFGRFWPDPKSREVRIRLSANELPAKEAAVGCFASQRAVTGNFPIGEERVRPAPRYRFADPAPPGQALYDRFGWTIVSARWRELAAAAIADIRSYP